MAKRTCLIDDCGRPYVARGWCMKHYQRFRPRQNRGICSLEGCGEPIRARGWCNKHYHRWKRWGDPQECGRQPKGQCAVDGCEREVKTRDWCSMHYLRWLRLGDPLGRKGRPQRLCLIEGCRTKHFGRGYCRLHHRRWRDNGDPLVVRKKANGQADFYSQGYHFITVDGKIVREHRHVMEQVLGRSLRPEETPHHKNGNRADNRPENLELWVRGQPAGQRARDLLAWAEEIVTRYGPERDKL